jgi:hypothetical protein
VFLISAPDRDEQADPCPGHFPSAKPFPVALYRRPHIRCGPYGNRETSGGFRGALNQATSRPERGRYTDPHINKLGHTTATRS